MRNVVPPRKAITASVLVKTVVVLFGCAQSGVSERRGEGVTQRKQVADARSKRLGCLGCTKRLSRA